MENAINILSWIGAILTSIVLIPQSYKIIRTRDTKSLSLYMYIIFVLSAITWITFAVLSNQPAIITTNTIVLFFALIILTLKITNILKKRKNPNLNYLVKRKGFSLIYLIHHLKPWLPFSSITKLLIIFLLVNIFCSSIVFFS